MMALSTWWWILAGLAVVAELLTGTVYLLLIGAGMVAGALAAHAGLALTTQIVIAAVVGAGLVAVWWRIRAPARRAAEPPQANADLNLDIGQTVHIDIWSAEGAASVMHRGARWTAVPVDRQAPAPAPGAYRIVAIEGASLVVAPLATP
ncbi:NfeD family protein [Xylophilus sp. GOD-11R]|uniref:NfeD family protein n=1 Tax=Xylophilus sp. GOD-11R TaxID=3089814 RepID=UPI00298C0831|nr:NfeD family protein [Xylophilus sp. GOD-11R]WPB58868.1 NfeD family protein [Xylophilus sp. GOD-11R]